MDKYLETMLGKKKAAEVMCAVKAGKPIMITGRVQTGKTTLCNYLNSIGGNAAEDFNTCVVTLEKPLDCMIPGFFEKITASRQETSGNQKYSVNESFSNKTQEATQKLLKLQEILEVNVAQIPRHELETRYKVAYEKIQKEIQELKKIIGKA